MVEVKRYSLVKPTVNTPFHIDFDWWQQNDREWRVHLLSCLPAEYQQTFADSDNQEVDWIDPETAEEMNKIFFEVVIAPSYNEDALKVLQQKKNRIILVQKSAATANVTVRTALNGVLVQDRDLSTETGEDMKQATETAPGPKQLADLVFANKIVKHTKSNAIVLAKNQQLMASGVGQTSRVDALKQSIEKALHFEFDLEGAVMASDAFFPFADSVEIADKTGVKAVIQPGGSVRDQDSIEYCDAHGMAMVFTGIRHFKH